MKRAVDAVRRRREQKTRIELNRQSIALLAREIRDLRRRLARLETVWARGGRMSGGQLPLFSGVSACGSLNGRIERRGPHSSVFCARCGLWVYHAPRSDLQREPR